MSALQALEKEENRLSITTFCEALDTLMGGTGIPNGKVTEICGIAGIGKTQLWCVIHYHEPIISLLSNTLPIILVCNWLQMYKSPLNSVA